MPVQTYAQKAGLNSQLPTTIVKSDVKDFNNMLGLPDDFGSSLDDILGTSTYQDLAHDPEDFSNQLLDTINGLFDKFMNNSKLYQDVKDTNIKEAEKSYLRQRELMKLQYDLEKQMRSSQIQDTIEDLRKAGINPAVYFAQGGNANSSFGISSGSVNSASVNNPNSDTISSLVNAYAGVLASIASNKNADNAVLRSVISAVGSIFSFTKNYSSSQNLSDITRRNA